MAITSISPIADALIDPDTLLAFTIDDTYTTMRIEVDTLDRVEYLWDSSLGGLQTGYGATIVDNGDGTETWTLSADAGWDTTPLVIRVIENETGSEATTSTSWTLSGETQYPQDDQPYYGELGQSFTVTEDNVGVVVNVSHLDFVAGAQDGITVTNLGGGKVRLTARATTNDPNAIHTNVASEIFALTEKTGPSSGDLVILEDSTASYVKKNAERQNLGGARAPQKLGTDLDAIMLYTFDGDLTDSVAGGQTLNIETGGTTLYSTGIVSEHKGLWLEATRGVKSTAATIDTTKYPHGDFTVQVVLFPGKTIPESGIVDGRIFDFIDATDNDVICAVGIPATGSQSEPGCWYTDTTPTLNELVADNMVIGDGVRIHIAQRTYDAGGGSYTQELWVNNTIIETATGLAAPKAFDAGHLYQVNIGKNASTSGAFRMVLECVKVSDRKLTDTEMGDEFRKALGYPAI